VIFKATEIPSVLIVEPELLTDDRGFFATTFSSEDFARAGLDVSVAQGAVSWNRKKGTLRGLHFQADPHGQAKLVRCSHGAIHDVAVDLRPGSPTRHRWVAVQLSAENRRQLWIPTGFAHGFQTLEDGSEVVYQMSSPYRPGSARGVRFDDPAFGIEWPLEVSEISCKDLEYPHLS
jgi:dTDP-4-dehydrorhamnose 3,5-epimerase